MMDKGTQTPARDVINLSGLDEPFREDDLEWKPIAVSKKTQKALAAAYVTNRAVMERLDTVCGKDGWKNEFQPGPGGGIICGLSVRLRGEWVTKWDGAENTDIEAVKGGLSSSMRRAAVQWGIGRYLYDQPDQWVSIDEHGRFKTRPRLGIKPPDSKSAASAPVQPTASIKALQAFFSACGFTTEDRALRLDFVRALLGRDDLESFSGLSPEHRAVLLKRASGIADYLGNPEMVVQFAAWGRGAPYTISDGEHCKQALDDFLKEMAVI